MHSLSEIVEIMNSDDKKEFLNYLNKKNKRSDVKNISYFKILETDDINNKNKLFKNDKNKDAYHALRKRLYENLIEFLSNRTFEKNTDETHKASRFLVLSRFFLENNVENEALKFLKKAEEKAIQLEQFSLLNEIYQTQIQYLHLFDELNLDFLKEKIEFNVNQLEKESKFNFAYAFLRKELKEIHHQNKIVNFKELIEETLEKSGLSFEEIITYKSLYQFLFIANEFGNIHQNFSLLEPFVKSGYEFLESRKINSENHLFYHIQIVYFLANYHFRINQNKKSEQFLDEMMKLMLQKNQQFYKYFYSKYLLVYTLNLHFSGNSELAIEKIEFTFKNDLKKIKVEDLYDLKLSLASFYAQQNDKKSLKIISEMNHTDFWFEKKLGMLWTIRKNLMEILIHIQFENIELAISRLQSFKRRYKKYLLEVNEERVMDFISIVETITNKPEILNDLDFKEKVYKTIEEDTNKDPFILSFWGWLIGKIENKTPYEATLELIVKL